MTYIPLLYYGEEIYAIFVFYIFMVIFAFYLTIKMYIRYLKEKNPASLHLSLVFTSYTMSLAILIVGLAEAIITGYYKEIYRITIPMAYSMVIVGNFFLYLFAIHFTNRGKKVVLPLLLIGIIIILVHFLPWNWWGVPPSDYVGQISIRIYSTASLVIYSSVIYFSIFIICRQNRKLEKNKPTRLRLSLLSYAMICMVCFFLFMIIDTIFMIFFDNPGYSIYNYIAWVFVIFFFIFSYISLFTPVRLIMWIRRRDD